MIIAPKINTDSKPSLKIMANDDVNAIAGASVPVPLTILSDSSKFLLIAIATSLISSKSACCLIKLLSSAN